MLTRRLKAPLKRTFIQSTALNTPTNPSTNNPIIDSELYKSFNIINEKNLKEDNLFSQKTLPELLNMRKANQDIMRKIKNFEEVCRRNLFTDNLFIKQLTKNYIKKSKSLGYNEFLMEIFFRYMAIYQEIKGENSMKGKDISGKQFWDSALFEEIRRDLIYMSLPGVEIDTDCLISLLRSFQRLKYKDYEVLQGLAMKLVMECRNPSKEMLDQNSANPFTASEMIRYYHEKFEKNDTVSGM